MDELQIILVEIEARVNNRPLTYIPETIHEPEPLTPNHLLQGASIEPIPPVINTDRIKDPDFSLTTGSTPLKEKRKRFNHVHKMLRQWNEAWSKDYITALNG